MKKLISVIVPIYNVEKYLKRCVDSIIAQTYKNLEIILVDDGSQDNSLALCEEYAKNDKRIKVIHKKNGGLSDARNTGLQVATGEYISFIDSDDFIRNDMYEVMLFEMQRNQVDIMKSDFIDFSDEIEMESSQKRYKITVFTPLQAIDNFLMTEFSPTKLMKSTACDALYNRRVFFEGSKQVIKYPKGKINEDTYVFPDILFRANKIGHIDIAFYFYYKRMGSISNSSITKKEIESRDLWKCISKNIGRYTNKYEEICALNWAKRYILLLNRIYASEFKREYFEKILQEFLEDKDYLIEHVNDRKMKRTLKIIQNYNVYRILKKINTNQFY